MITFKEEVWLLLEKSLEESLNNQRNVLENIETTYKQKLVAIGDIRRIKTILAMPQTYLPLKESNANRNTGIRTS